MKIQHLKYLILLFLILHAAISNSIRAQAVAEVGGVLQKNTFWSSDTIYNITELLRVKNFTLTIEAGTRVKANQAVGISIEEGGALIANGTTNDSIRFEANHQENEDWYWQGIKIISVSSSQQCQLSYAVIRQATIGIEAIASDSISIQNSLITANRNIGIRLFNSSFARILNNTITENFRGVEIYATDPENRSANNLVKGNKLKNTTNNIIIFNYNYGSCPNNIIEENLILGGLHGIWLFNSSNGGSGYAHISRNIIISSGTEAQGYGIHVAMDSTILNQNIFWDNTIPVHFTNAHYCHLINNQIYANRKGLSIGNNASDIIAFNNTFTGNLDQLITFLSHEGVRFNENNIFFNRKKEELVENKIGNSINMTGNYWGTVDVAAISDLIYDVYDDPALGEIRVWPFLENALTSPPIAPPAFVEARLINGFMQLQWMKSKESDFSYFKIYQGNFEDYGFIDGFTQITSDTFFVFNEQPGWHQLAITASDAAAAKNQAMLNGHESAFAFPVLMPWAGNNMISCQTNEFIDLDAASAPPGYDSLYWTSTGDGNFNDETQLNPRYYPGEEDFQSGQLKLILHLVVEGKLLTDSVSVEIHPLPTLDAGQDAVIRKGDVFLTDQAEASNFEGVWWSTPGDGFFTRPDSLRTIYIPGINDLDQEQVLLILQVFTPACGTLSDTLVLSVKNMYSLQGTVAADGVFLPEQPVLAYYLNSGKFPQKMFLTHADASGNFKFDNLFEGSYYLYAPADTTSTLLSSYYATGNSWSEAYKLMLDANTYDIDLKLNNEAYKLPPGTASIHGFFELPTQLTSISDTYCQSWFSDATFTCSTGLPNVSVNLYSGMGEQLLQHTLTSKEGIFRFEQLPFGDYRLKAEIAGYESDFSPLISLSPGMSAINDVRLFVQDQRKITIEGGEARQIQLSSFIYPNPVKEHLFLNLDQFEDAVTIEVFRLDGRKILELNPSLSQNPVQISFKNIAAGSYLVKLSHRSHITSTIILKE